MSKILKKVIFKYSDGTSKFLEGEEVIKWDRYCESVCILAHNHGMNPPWHELKWIENKKIKKT